MKKLFKHPLFLLCLLLLTIAAGPVSGPIITKIRDLNDTRIQRPEPTDGDALIYNAAGNYWTNGAVSGGGGGGGGGVINTNGTSTTSTNLNVVSNSDVLFLGTNVSGRLSLAAILLRMQNGFLDGTTVIRGRMTNEIQPLLTGNVLNGTNQYNSATSTTATTSGAVSNLVEMLYTVWLTNSITTVITTFTNVTDYVGYRGINSNSITKLQVEKRGSKTFMYIFNNPGRWSLTFSDITNAVVDGTIAPYQTLVLTNNCNVLWTNINEALTLTVRQDSVGFRAVTFVNNAFTTRSNASLAVGTNGVSVITVIPGTNSAEGMAIVQTGFQ